MIKGEIMINSVVPSHTRSCPKHMALAIEFT